MKLLWMRPASAARDEIIEYIAEDNIDAALSMDELFSAADRRIFAHPFSGKPGRVPGTYELVVHPHYVLVYEIEGEEIRILMLLYTSRQWPPRAVPKQ
jgi:addiction module toxin, RelE/StbE family